LSILGEHQGIARKHAQHVYWVDGPWWFGKLALAARPRGGDWLAEEVAFWKSAGIGAVLSLLTPEEERELDLVRMREEEKKKTEGLGLEFWSLPIEDRQVPDSDTRFGAALNLVDNSALSRRECSRALSSGSGENRPGCGLSPDEAWQEPQRRDG